MKIVDNIDKNSKILLTFLNNSLRDVMRKLSFIEIGKSKKYFNTQ